MFKKTAIIAGIGLALSATAQADYRWALGAGYGAGSFDYETKNPKTIDDDTDTDVWGLSGTYYLENVDTSKGPLNEAAFLDHASNVSLEFSDGEIDISNGDDEDGQTYSFDSRYVAEGPGWKLSGWLVDLGYERSEPGDAEIDTWGLGIGKYITPNTTLVLGYENASINNGGDVDRWGVDLEHFFAFDNGGIKARVSGGKTVVSGEDDPTTWTLGGTWYIGNNWGIAADFKKDDASGFEVDHYALGVQWFITESFAVDLTYENTEPDDIDWIRSGQKLETSYDEIGISALYRF
jgi:hypothetical protein